MSSGNYYLTLRAAQRANKTSEQTIIILIDNKEAGRFMPPSTSYTAFTTDTFNVTTGQHLIELRGVDSLARTILLSWIWFRCRWYPIRRYVVMN